MIMYPFVARLSVDDGDDIDIWIIIVIVICVFIVIILWVICTGIAHVCVRKNTGMYMCIHVYVVRSYVHSLVLKQIIG